MSKNKNAQKNKDNSSNVNVDLTAKPDMSPAEPGKMKEVHTSMGTVLIDDKGEVHLKRGRSIDPDSDRQKRLNELEKKKALGLNVGRGRPVDETSDRQKKLAERESKLDAGMELKRGRPENKDSVRQQKLAERQAKINKIKAEIAAQEAKTEEHNS